MEDEIIFERLTLLRNEIAYLRSEGKGLNRLEDYRDNPRLKRAVERSLQVAVEACLDMGRRIIAEQGLRFPDDNKDVFESLAEAGLVSAALLPRLLKMAQFRNLIVQNYARIDDFQVYSILQRSLADFDEYATAVARWVDAA